MIRSVLFILVFYKACVDRKLLLLMKCFIDTFKKLSNDIARTIMTTELMITVMIVMNQWLRFSSWYRVRAPLAATMHGPHSSSYVLHKDLHLSGVPCSRVSCNWATVVGGLSVSRMNNLSGLRSFYGIELGASTRQIYGLNLPGRILRVFHAVRAWCCHVLTQNCFESSGYTCYLRMPFVSSL